MWNIHHFPKLDTKIVKMLILLKLFNNLSEIKIKISYLLLLLFRIRVCVCVCKNRQVHFKIYKKMQRTSNSQPKTNKQTNKEQSRRLT